MDPPSSAAIAAAAGHLVAAKYFQLAAFVMLVYDHIITFDDEVEKIWKGKITGAAILFLVNRYASPLEFIVILVAFHESSWPPEVCSRFVRFEGSGTLGLVSVCELIMIIRVYALYKRNIYILGFLLTVWVLGIVIASIGMSRGVALELPPPLTGCIDTGGGLFPALWVVPLVTNSLIFFLTLYKSRELVRGPGVAPTLHVFVRDGTVYFLIIFMANLLNTLIYFLAEEDLKAIGASFSQLITSTMVSRLVLNLKSSADPPSHFSSQASTWWETRTMGKLMDHTIGNLGEELESFGGSRSDDLNNRGADRRRLSQGFRHARGGSRSGNEEFPMITITKDTFRFIE